MKKFIVLIFLLIFSSVVFAYEYPRWVSQPINVYIPDVPYFADLMERAFDEWEIASDDLVRFKYVNRPLEADITVQFVDFVTNCSSNHAVGCTHMTTRGKNYYKSLITIATKESKVRLNSGIFEQTDSKRHVDNI